MPRGSGEIPHTLQFNLDGTLCIFLHREKRNFLQIIPTQKISRHKKAPKTFSNGRNGGRFLSGMGITENPPESSLYRQCVALRKNSRPPDLPPEEKNS
jgi:hypothetical protein